MSQSSTLSAHVNPAPESFADDILAAVQTGLLPDRYEPSAEDWTELEQHEAYLALMAEEAMEREYPGAYGFGLPANEWESF